MNYYLLVCCHISPLWYKIKSNSRWACSLHTERLLLSKIKHFSCLLLVILPEGLLCVSFLWEDTQRQTKQPKFVLSVLKRQFPTTLSRTSSVINGNESWNYFQRRESELPTSYNDSFKIMVWVQAMHNFTSVMCQKKRNVSPLYQT